MRPPKQSHNALSNHLDLVSRPSSKWLISWVCVTNLSVSTAKRKKHGAITGTQANRKLYHLPSGMRASHHSYVKIEPTVICLCCFCQRAMDVVGFRPDEKSSIYSLLSAILNLGNVTFDEGDDHSAGHDFVSLSNGKCKLKSSNYLLYRFTPRNNL